MTHPEKIDNLLHTPQDKLDILQQLTKARYQARLTQNEVAIRMGTVASSIARLESGGGKKKHSPSLNTLRDYATVLNCDIKMTLIPKKPEVK